MEKSLVRSETPVLVPVSREELNGAMKCDFCYYIKIGGFRIDIGLVEDRNCCKECLALLLDNVPSSGSIQEKGDHS